MQEFKFENQGSNTYLVYTFAPEERIDSMCLGMLTNNNIPGLAPAIISQMNLEKRIMYNVSAKISLDQFFSGSVNRRQLLGVFSGLVDGILATEDYMIDPRMLLLEPGFIFVDVSSCEPLMICLPAEDNLRQSDVATFFKNIMFSTQFEQSENVDYVARIINFLNRSAVPDLREFQQLLASLTAGPSSTGAQQSAAPQVPVYQPPVYQPPVQQAPVQQAPVYQPPVQQAPVYQPPVQQASVQQPPVQQPPAPQVQVRQGVAQQQAEPAAAQGKRVSPQYDIPGGVPVAPAKKEKSKKKEKKAEASGSGEKQMSMLYLLAHYSKENAEIYKAQQADKKQTKSDAAETPSPKRKSGAQQTAPAALSGQINIPGQPPQPQYQPPQPQVQPQYQAPAVQYASAVAQAAPPAANAVQGSVFDDISDDTVIMGEESELAQFDPYLLRKKTNEKIYLDKPVFRIGRDQEFNDYVTADNVYVGHVHCHIISRDGEFFIVDDNTKNHTYVSGELIPSGVEVKLSHGQRVTLANEEFEFLLF